MTAREFSLRPARPGEAMALSELCLLSKAYWEGRDFAESSLEPPIGSGPYRIGEVKPGRSITYVLRDDYWARDLPVAKGKWNFGELHYEYFKDSTAAFEAFKSGELVTNVSDILDLIGETGVMLDAVAEQSERVNVIEASRSGKSIIDVLDGALIRALQ